MPKKKNKSSRKGSLFRFDGIKESVKGIPPTWGGKKQQVHGGVIRPWGAGVPDYWAGRQDGGTDPFKAAKRKKSKVKARKKKQKKRSTKKR